MDAQVSGNKPSRWKDGVHRGFLGRIRKELRPFACELYRRYLNRAWGTDIGRDCMISLSATIDRTYPRGVHIGESTAVSFGAVVMTHDYTRRLHVDTRIGSHCQIGAHSLIMPGVTIGDECIVAPASVVMKDVPSNTLVAGNPARMIERGIHTGRWGILIREPAVEPQATEESDRPPPATTPQAPGTSVAV